MGQATSLKFGVYNLLPSIFTLLFIYCSEFIFKESYLPSDSHTNTVNLRPICWSSQNAMPGAIFLHIADYSHGICNEKVTAWNLPSPLICLCFTPLIGPISVNHEQRRRLRNFARIKALREILERSYTPGCHPRVFCTDPESDQWPSHGRFSSSSYHPLPRIYHQ